MPLGVKEVQIISRLLSSGFSFNKLLDLKIRKIASSDKYTDWWNKNIATNTRWTQKMLVKNSITSQIYKIKQTKFMNILPKQSWDFPLQENRLKHTHYKCF
ncbi:hypothetical protein ACR82Z_03065 [Mycoplasma sp. 6243]|uniref:hypothetical protein n=1 Tax=Mycoplasma sp. 6243 TaxID=3440865 RepID=UPI003EC0814B